MVSIDRIILGSLCLYTGLGLLYRGVYINYKINNSTLGEILRIAMKPPFTIKLLNTIFSPLIQVYNYFALKLIEIEENNEEK